MPRKPYSGAWQRIRLGVLAREPLCRFCAQQGRTVAAIDVDHIDGNARNNSPDNLRPLCKRCHSARTQRDQGRNRGKRVHGCDLNGAPLDPSSHWNAS